MALLHFERLGIYNPLADITDMENVDTGGTSGMTFQATGGRFGERVLSDSTDSISSYVVFDVAGLGASTTNGSTLILNLSFKIDAQNSGRQILLGTTRPSIFSFCWSLVAYADGTMQVRDSVNTTQLSIPDAFVPLAWNHMEIKVTHDNSGTFDMVINGITVAALTGIDTMASSGGPLASVALFGFDDGVASTEPGVLWGDIVIMDDTGSTFNDFIGDMRLELALPDADGGTVDWTRNAGTDDYAAVDDAIAAYDDDTTYLESTTAGEDSLLSYPTSTLANVNTLHFVGMASRIRDDGGVAPLQATHIVNSSATVAEGDTHALASSYQFIQDTFETDPDTGVAWTKSGVDAAEFGIRSIT